MNARTNSKIDPLKQASRSKLEIVPRKVKFDYSDINKAAYHGDNIVISAYWAALSSTFPIGETEFINSVKLFKSGIKDEKLLSEIRDFTAQEAHHGLQHRKLNKQLTSVGFDIKAVEDMMAIELEKRDKKWSPEKRLRRTVSAEHFTATMAHHALMQPQSLDAAPEMLKNLLLWHAIEEVEHKSVTFDVYESSGCSMTTLKFHYLYFALIEFPFQMWMITRFLLKQGGFKVTWKDRKDFLKYLFGRKSMYGSMKGYYLMFLKKGFHPWQVDDSALIEKWKEKLSPFFVDQTNQSEQKAT